MALGAKGIDVRISGSTLVFRVSLKTSAGVDITSGGPFVLKLYEVQSDGTLKSFDFGAGQSHQWTFVSTVLGTETAALTHQHGNNGTTDTGIWTYALTTVSGFTIGGIYVAKVTDTAGTATASPVSQEREFQYGGDQGDQTAQTGDSYAIVKSGGAGDNAAIKTVTDKFAFTVTNQVDSNVIDWKSATAPAMTGDAYARLGAPTGASIAADIQTRGTSTYAGADTAGTTTLLTRVTAAVALDSTVAKDATVSKPGTAQTITANQNVNVNQWFGGAQPTIGTSTLTQTQVTGGAYDLTNATYIAALKAGLGTVPASVATGQLADISAIRAAKIDNLDAAITTRMATYTQPTGFLAATFPTTVASTTNITAASGVALAASQHVIVDSGTVTTLTNLPSIPANWLTATGIAAAALNGKGDWNSTTPPTAAANATAVMASVIETGVTLTQAVRQIGAGTAGKLTQTGTGPYTVALVGLDDATTRASWTVDAAGQRTAVTRTL